MTSIFFILDQVRLKVYITGYLSMQTSTLCAWADWRVSSRFLYPGDVEFWQNILPLALGSPRSSREQGPCLFPIWRATNRTKNVSPRCPKDHSLHSYNNCCYYSCLSVLQACGRCPTICRGFPHSLEAIFVHFPSITTPAVPGSPSAWQKSHILFCYFLFNHYGLLHKLNNLTSPLSRIQMGFNSCFCGSLQSKVETWHFPYM